MRELEPRRDVGVVVELRAEDLVARPELAARRAREREVERRHVRAEHGLVRRAAEEPRRRSRARARRAPRCGGSSRTARCRSRSTRASSREIASITSSGTCVPPGPSKNDEVALERREPRAGGGDVERHAARFSHAASSSRLALRRQPRLARPLGDVAGGLRQRPEGQPGCDRAIDRHELKGCEVGVVRRNPAGKIAPPLDLLLGEELLRHPDDVGGVGEFRRLPAPAAADGHPGGGACGREADQAADDAGRVPRDRAGQAGPLRTASPPSDRPRRADVAAGEPAADPGDQLVVDGADGVGPLLRRRLAARRRGPTARPRRRRGRRRPRRRARTGPCRPGRRWSAALAAGQHRRAVAGRPRHAVGVADRHQRERGLPLGDVGVPVGDARARPAPAWSGRPGRAPSSPGAARAPSGSSPPSGSRPYSATPGRTKSYQVSGRAMRGRRVGQVQPGVGEPGAAGDRHRLLEDRAPARAMVGCVGRVGVGHVAPQPDDRRPRPSACARAAAATRPGQSAGVAPSAGEPGVGLEVQRGPGGRSRGRAATTSASPQSAFTDTSTSAVSAGREVGARRRAARPAAGAVIAGRPQRQGLVEHGDAEVVRAPGEHGAGRRAPGRARSRRP